MNYIIASLGKKCNNMDSKAYLPPEIWDPILTRLARLSTKQTIKLRLISSEFDRLVEANREINYSLLVIHSDRTHKNRIGQFIWICTIGKSEIYVGYSKILRLRVIEWAIDRFNIVNIDGDIFIAICRKGYLKVIKLLVDKFNLSRKDIKKAQKKFCRYGDVFCEAVCENGHLEVLQYLLEKFGLITHRYPYPEGLFRSLIYPASRNGHLKVVQWVAKKFDLGHEAIYPGEFPFEDICCNGHLNILRWLSGTSLLDVKKIKRKWDTILENTYKNGRTETVKWLIVTYYSPDCADVGSIFRLACKYKNIYVARWLVNTLRVTSKDIRMYRNASLICACKNGDFNMIDLILKSLINMGENVSRELWVISENISEFYYRKWSEKATYLP